jgi:CBS domain-containing protein
MQQLQQRAGVFSRSRPIAKRRSLTVMAALDINRPRVDRTVPLRNVLRLMGKYSAQHALVFDGADFLGIVSERDIRLALPSRFADPNQQQASMLMLTAGDVCQSRPPTIDAGAPLADAGELLIKSGIDAIVVTAQDDFARQARVVGVLSTRDIVRVWLAEEQRK